ncbi:DedA family protein [Pseudonocardia xinjiangensis]|uniref:DedA family protein n=1 Tax=Pseudonocardia xinjiangensis TaxID=75289 RepID=UPI003D94AB8D
MRLPVDPTAAYLVVLLWTSLPFTPAEPVLVLGGSWSATGALWLPLVIAASAVGSLISDLVKYAVGWYAGPALLARLRRRPAGARAADWVEARMRTAGAGVIVPSYFVPVGVVVSTVLCGALRLPVGAVVRASIVGAVLWSAMYVLIGYAGGRVTGDPLLGLAIGMPAALVLGALLARRARARSADDRRRAAAATPPVSDPGSP